MFRVHFGNPTHSKYFNQAIEISNFAFKYEIFGSGEDSWHIVSFIDEQIELMASLYPLATKLPYPKIYGADLLYMYAVCVSNGNFNYFYASKNLKEKVDVSIQKLKDEKGYSYQELAEYLNRNYIKPIQNDMNLVRDKLIEEGWIDFIDPKSQSIIKAIHAPNELIESKQNVIKRINNKDYLGAIEAYYESIGNKRFGEYTKELLYLKRLSNTPVIGRDLLFFRNKTFRTDLVEQNIREYESCIDQVLAFAIDYGFRSPLEIMIECVPTMEELIDALSKKYNFGVRLENGQIHRELVFVTADDFTYKYHWCSTGRFFKHYPDPILFCRVLNKKQRPGSLGLWTKYSPEYLMKNVYEKGLHINYLDIYYHKLWGKYTPGSKRSPDFTNITSNEDVRKISDFATETVESVIPGVIRFTGRTHKIENIHYYEIDIIKTGANIEADIVSNPLIEAINEILREAENKLREMHGLPRIGEGWLSEMRLFNLVVENFPNALHQASPEWIKPQHLDIFIPSHNLAFEYQGLQHYEPIDFFGGINSLEDTQKRDKNKENLCKKNKINLIHWRYDEPIEKSILVTKLNNIGIEVTEN
jgi:hypothetical protein